MFYNVREHKREQEIQSEYNELFSIEESPVYILYTGLYRCLKTVM